MTVVRSTFWRTWTTTKRAYPWTYFTSTVLSGALTIALAYLVYHAIGDERATAQFAAAAGAMDYVGYVAVGAIAYAFTVRMVLWTAKALITEEREGTIVALAVAPAGRLPYLLGFGVFSLVSTLAEVAALCVVAGVLGVRLPSLDPLGLTLGMAVLAIAVFAISLILCVVMLHAAEAHITQNTAFLVMGVLCGFTFPRSFLPGGVQWLGEILPVTAALDVVRSVLDDGFTLGQAAPRMLTALAVSAVYLLAGLWLLPGAERRVMERTF